jgi:hypothetical protein
MRGERFILSFLEFFASLRGFFDVPEELWQKYVPLIHSLQSKHRNQQVGDCF